jgi:anaerobic carbon-monoxide dehydrogenase iron sulfur subunit
MKTLRPLPNNCTGCRLCVMSCSFFHHQSFSEAQARLKVLADEAIWKFEPVVCRQCEDAPCAAACPTAAISRDLNTNAVLLDPTACNGCEACVLACPYEAIVFDRDHNITQLCDLCRGNPECVAACPHSAILYTEDQTTMTPATWFGEPILR